MASTSPWESPQFNSNIVSFSSIVKSEKTKKEKLKHQIEEDFNFAKELAMRDTRSPVKQAQHQLNELEASSSKNVINSVTIPNEATTELDDLAIAQILQAEYDLELDGEIKKIEQSRNKNSKISISLANYRMYPDEMLDESSDKEDEDVVEARREKNWDRFIENDKEISKIGKSGYREDNGKILTKHDANLSGRKNAGKIMELNDFPSGDCGNFDMKVSNKVFNEIRKHSNQMAKKHNQAHLDRKMDMKTNEMGVDVKTRLILYKLINNTCILDFIDGIISTGKEAVILHGETNQNNDEYPNLPKEVAIKIFSTTLNEFKQRDRYIKDDYRFKGSLKQNNKNIIQQWCEKEMHNLNRLRKAKIRCPEVVIVKKHILVMSYIGSGYDNPAPKLKNAILSDDELTGAYKEVVDIMKTMYHVARLVHADLSEFNILWHEGSCVVIDLAQAVEPVHPAALEYLMRDCANITNFFDNQGVEVVSKEQLFFDITRLDPLTTNTTMLERIHMKGDASHAITLPQNLDDVEREKVPEKFRLKEFPFDYAWQKVEELKGKTKIIKVEVNPSYEDLNKEDDEWVIVKSSVKKRNKRRGECKTIVDRKIADSLKEISVSK